MACMYGLYVTTYGILGAIYGCYTFMWYHTCGAIYGTIYDVGLVKYGRTLIKLP